MPVAGIVSFSPSFGAGVNVAGAFVAAKLARVLCADAALTPFPGNVFGGWERGVR